MIIAAIVAGTGFDGRAEVIRRYCRPQMAVYLVREPDNVHDKDAIAVYIKPKLFGLIPSAKQIGYIKHRRADNLAIKLDAGMQYRAWIESMWAPDGRDWPRVSLRIDITQ